MGCNANRKRVRWNLNHEPASGSNESPSSIENARHRALLFALVLYAVFVCIIFYLSYASQDKRGFLLAEVVRNDVFASSDNIGFTTIRDVADYWRWIRLVILPALYATTQPDGSALNASLRSFANGLVNIRVGGARLRQHRVKYGPCLVHPDNLVLAKDYCEPSYRQTTADTDDWGESWRKIPDNPIWSKSENKSSGYTRYLNGTISGDPFRHTRQRLTVDDGNIRNASSRTNHTPWQYRTAYELMGVPYMGVRAIYSGGGYLLHFDDDLRVTEQILDRYQKQGWMDERTRAVLLEFSLYNVNTNLFISATMLVEFLVTGSTVTHSSFRVFRLFHFTGTSGNVEFALEIVYCCFILYFLVRMMITMKRQGCRFFHKFWNLIELIRIIMAIVCIALFAVKQELTQYVRSWIRLPPENFLNMQSLGAYDEILSYTLALVVFLATLQFLKLLQFNRRLRMLGDVLHRSYIDLRNFSAMFFVFMLAFSIFAYLLFGRVSGAFYNLAATIEALFTIALGDFNYSDISTTQTILAPLFFFTYVVVIYVVLMTIFLSILNKAISEVNAVSRLRRNDYELLSYIHQRLISTSRRLVRGLARRIVSFIEQCRRHSQHAFSPQSSERSFYIRNTQQAGCRSSNDIEENRCYKKPPLDRNQNVIFV